VSDDISPSTTEQELLERLAFERVMTRLLRMFVDAGNDEIDACIEDGLRLIAEAAHADRGYVFLTNDGGLSFSNTHEWCAPGSPSLKAALQDIQSPSALPSWWHRIMAQETVSVPSRDALPEGSGERAMLERFGIDATLAAPMIARDAVIGAIGLQSRSGARDWSPATCSLLEQFGGVVNAALDRQRSVASLRASEERFRRLIQNSADVVIVLDAVGNFTYASPKCEALIGYRPEELVGTSALSLIHPDEVNDAAIAIANTGNVLLEEGAERIGFRIRHRDGSWIPVEVNGSSVLDDPLLAGIIVNVRDMRENARLAATLEEVEVRFRQVFDHSPIGLAIGSNDGHFANANAALCRMLGYTKDELQQFTFRDVTHPDDIGTNADLFAAMVRGETDGYVVEKRYQRADGSYMWVRVNATGVRNADGVTLYCIVQVEDITERKKIEQRLSYEATHDALTGLPLRTLLLDHLELALAGAKRRDTSVAVLFIDLDRFKHVNDSLGHTAGDELLAIVAQRIRDAVRHVDTPGRFGGDEFVVVCPDLSDVRDVVAIAERIRQLLETPVEIRGVQVFVGASIGIAVADRGTDAATLLRQADTAAYRAKERGRNRYEIFDEELRAAVARRLDTEMGLRHALDHDELHLVYQPIVAMEFGEVVGFEALVRWGRDGKVIGPADFLGVAEDTGLIVPLGRQVLEKACRQLAEWQQLLTADQVPRMSVNLSARQLTQVELADDVERILTETGVPASRLCLEITETVLMQDTPQVISTINALRSLGVRLAIDDFGTGYSSLSYLRRLPVGAVKIDRSFILELGADHEGSTIVASVIGLAHALGMEIIAEGVETIEHVAALLNLGCDLAQGYYFSRPVAPQVAFEFLCTGVIPQNPAA
jgi:diguanylate cyclase (GGDEF)-like protein/PAS domain S-box-containing protein